MKQQVRFLCCLLITAAVAQAQNVITVDNSPGSAAQFNDLQTAIASASAGDIIYVHPSETNYGTIEVDKQLTLIGFSHSSADKASLLTDLSLGENASNTRISGFHITDDFIIDNPTTTLTGIVFENNKVDDSMLFSNAGVDGITIRGNVIDFLGSVSNGSTANEYTNALITNNIITSVIYVRFSQSITIKNNVFLGADINHRIPANGNQVIQNCIFLLSSTNTLDLNDDSLVFEHCLAFNRSSGNVDALSGTNNIINIDPLFTELNDNLNYESALDDYSLQAGSPGLNAGVNGEDLGLFDGSGFVFDNFGFTNGIPTVNIQAISTTVAPGQNLNVIISTSNQ